MSVQKKNVRGRTLEGGSTKHLKNEIDTKRNRDVTNKGILNRRLQSRYWYGSRFEYPGYYGKGWSKGWSKGFYGPGWSKGYYGKGYSRGYYGYDDDDY